MPISFSLMLAKVKSGAFKSIYILPSAHAMELFVAQLPVYFTVKLQTFSTALIRKLKTPENGTILA